MQPKRNGAASTTVRVTHGQHISDIGDSIATLQVTHQMLGTLGMVRLGVSFDLPAVGVERSPSPAGRESLV
jgi:hypothetical protein